MNARKYFLNEHIFPNAVIGSCKFETNLFQEPFISLNDLIYGLQNKVNIAAGEILDAPNENTKLNAEITWKVLYNLLTEIQNI